LKDILKHFVPNRFRPAVKGLLGIWAPSSYKYKEEIEFWKNCFREEGGKLENSHYEKPMLAMAGEPDASFLAGKIIADFGCGPRGSLCWATRAKLRIGIDVLSKEYSIFDIRSHNMCYVSSSETTIPLPSNYVDVLFTMNAMDHVSYFKRMCKELVRILVPGGVFVGSFNLGRRPTFSEPHSLSEENVREGLLRHLIVESYRIAPEAPRPGSVYRYFYKDTPRPTSGSRFLWVRASKTTHLSARL
jgi:SAM-dependent methyltransferase